MAITLAPRNELSHYASIEDVNAAGRVADRLKRERDQRLIWARRATAPATTASCTSTTTTAR